MDINKKVAASLLVWLAGTALAFFWLFPKLSGSLIELKQSHAKQIAELNQLKDYAKGVERMQQDLATMRKGEVQPEEFFTSDIKLVNEIKHIESIALETNNAIIFNISGTADKAAAVKGASSALFEIPYTITLEGNQQTVQNFVSRLEKSYFVSPVNAVSYLVDNNGVLVARVVANFYIQK